MVDKSQERISALLAKKAQLEERIQRLKSRSAVSKRKERTHALLLLGVTLEKQLKEDPSSTPVVHDLLQKFLRPVEQSAVLKYLQQPTGGME